MKFVRSASLLFCFAALSAVSLSLAADASADKKADAVKKELKKFTGKWSIVSMIRNGNEIDAEQLGQLRVIYTEDGKFSVKADTFEYASGAIKLDPTTKPKSLEMTFKPNDGDEQTFFGIYEIDDKEYRVCHNKNGDKELPKEFASKEGSGHSLSVMKRDKEEKKEEKK